MTPGDFLRDVLAPGLFWMEQNVGFVPPASREARLLLLAIAGQESAWSTRVQSGNGPAHSYWQMERRGGVAGVLGDVVTSRLALKACWAAAVTPNSMGVWRAMATPSGDNLSVAFARLLLWADPNRLPAYGNQDTAWYCYLENWRPGKPSASRWLTVYPQALAADEAWSAGATHQGPTP